MVYVGYLRMGGNEIVNSPRAEGITRSTDCYVPWIDGDSCPFLQDAVGDTPYSYANIASAPWYDPSQVDVSSRVLGVYGMGFSGVKDSTRQVQITEGLDDGGVIGSMWKGVLQVRVRVAIIALGDDAMEYARTWLGAALDPGACGQHSEECGTTDIEYLATCPPERGMVLDPVDYGFGEGPFGETSFGGGSWRPQTDAEYAASIDPLRRYLHGVAATSGPNTIEEFRRKHADGNDIVGQTVEFTLTASRPWVYGVTKPVDLPSTTPFVVEDVRYNLVKFPSMQLTTNTPVVIGRNYSTNPSVETNITGWSFSSTGAITEEQLSDSRSTELAAVGTASYKVAFTSTTTGAGTMTALQTVALPAPVPLPAVSRFSVNMWAAAIATTGTPTLSTISFSVDWLDASNAVLRTDALGTAPASGGSVTLSNILPPTGATQARVSATVTVSSIATGNVVNLFADALAVTIP